MRKEAVAGQFYESSREKLESQLKELFSSAKKVQNKGLKSVNGLIVPHAGYFYSGKSAAAAYSLIKNMGKIDTFIIIGVNHSGQSALSFEDFETPLGIAENDREFSKKISNAIGIDEIENAHRWEHSIEVQLPFIQFLAKKQIKIVPLLLGDMNFDECGKIARAIFQIAGDLNRRICLIASSDFTHYGSSYNFLPFSGNSEEIKKKLYALDRKAIDFIEKKDSKKFFEYSSQTTICGRIPTTIAVEYCKLIKSKPKLVDYYTSGDIVKDYSSAVGYAAIVF